VIKRLRKITLRILATGSDRYHDIFAKIVVVGIEVTNNYVQQVFGTGSRFPTGQRGLVIFYRNTSAVLDAAEFRILAIT
jgi:hypothetical protein